MQDAFRKPTSITYVVLTGMRYLVNIPEVQGRVANPRPVAKIKTGLVSQPITDANDETGRDRSCIATRPRSVVVKCTK